MKQELRIKEICREKGITLEVLANKLGILRTSLSQALSRNSFSTDKLKDIACALDVPMWQLFASPCEVIGGSNYDSPDFSAIIDYKGELWKVTSVEELEKVLGKLKGGCDETAK